ncbi:OmpA family protein [Colwellia sp. C1TZA3]|uniref:OmpA family protein n=1 Tax=Colwellia sp. C1TZA3 TaxID=2508879 RepID=UPI0011B99FD7|nr:OmpA family protein [Colwellia sp. C1TZA3]TWX65024.1 OmpA family protein [Colwellia sp. C1TZA3]
MNYIMTILLTLAISGCSIQIQEMTPEPTVQKADLADIEADGIINARDQCQDSFVGASVANNGCGSDRIEELKHKLQVNFIPNSYTVEWRFLSEIKKLAEFMKDNPRAKLTIEGHTSKRGTKVLNQILSQNRAQAIQNILVNKFMVEQARITAIGYGFDRLLLAGDDEYIHARNRRIVAKLSREKLLTDMKWTIYSVDQAEE